MLSTRLQLQIFILRNISKFTLSWILTYKGVFLYIKGMLKHFGNWYVGTPDYYFPVVTTKLKLYSFNFFVKSVVYSFKYKYLK